MQDWSYYRIEYGGHATECIVEGGIWLPPGADPQDIEEYLMRTQRREVLPNNEAKTEEVLGKDGTP